MIVLLFVDDLKGRKLACWGWKWMFPQFVGNLGPIFTQTKSVTVLMWLKACNFLLSKKFFAQVKHTPKKKVCLKPILAQAHSRKQLSENSSVKIELIYANFHSNDQMLLK